MEHPLTQYRKKNGLTLQAFAERIGTTKSVVHRWETGLQFPRPEFMFRVQEATQGEVSANDFLRSREVAG